MENRSMFVGLDVHKETIDVSIAEGDRQGEVRHYGVIASDLEPLDKVVRALRAPDRQLHFVYEAGPCGFGIYRHLTKRGEDCVIVSPSMIPKRSGDRVKTDRRDSQMLARLHRALERPHGAARRDHQGGQSACATVARGSGLGVSRDSADWTATRVSPGGPPESRV